VPVSRGKGFLKHKKFSNLTRRARRRSKQRRAEHAVAIPRRVHVSIFFTNFLGARIFSQLKKKNFPATNKKNFRRREIFAEQDFYQQKLQEPLTTENFSPAKTKKFRQQKICAMNSQKNFAPLKKNFRRSEEEIIKIKNPLKIRFLYRICSALPSAERSRADTT
jgi:hypothetical protein